MSDQKYCPLSREAGVKCARWCAWYDELEQQCAVVSLATEMMALSENIDYAITKLKEGGDSANT